MGGLPLHLWVAGIAIATTLTLFFTRLRAVAAGAGLVVAALALDGGLRYPDLILSEAARYQPAQPRCLMLGPALLPPQTRADLMALTMAKDSTGPSDALLLVQTDSARRLLRWSFRARRCVQAPALTEARPLCTPTTLPLLPD